MSKPYISEQEDIKMWIDDDEWYYYEEEYYYDELYDDFVFDDPIHKVKEVISEII